MGDVLRYNEMKVDDDTVNQTSNGPTIVKCNNDNTITDKESNKQQNTNIYSSGAPDGGWGWVVVLASFMVHVMADGFSYSLGALATELIDHFDASRESVGWMMSILVGITLSAGPMASILCNQFGYRKVTIFGGILSSLGCCGPFIYPKFWFIYVSLSVVMGIGFGLMYFPAIVTVSIYFHRKRAFAIGLAVCGSGIGTFVISPLMEYLTAKYGWQGTLLLIGGLMLNCIAFGACFRPLPDTIVDLMNTEINVEDEIEEIQSVKRPQSTCPQNSSTIKLITTPTTPTKTHDQYKEQQPEQDPYYLKDRTFMSVINVNAADNPNHRQDQSNAETNNSRWVASEPDLKNAQLLPTSHRRRSNVRSHDHRKNIFHVSHPILMMTSQISLQKASFVRHRRHSSKEENNQNVSLGILSDNHLGTELALGSVKSFDSNSSTVKHCLKESCSFDLMKNPIFLLFAISNFFTSIGFNAPFLYAKDRAILLDIDNNRASLLISSTGIGNTIGRVIFGYLSTKKYTNRVQLYNWSLTLSGIVIILSNYALTYPAMIAYTCFFGILTGTYVTLTSVVLVDLLGIENLNASFGLTLVFQGTAVFVGPPLAGYIYDVTHSFDWSFGVCGMFLAASGIMLFLVYCSKDFRKKHSLFKNKY